MSLLTTLLTQSSSGGGGGGSGDVNGPGSSTANGLVSFNGTGGKTIQSQSNITTGANSTLTGGTGEDLILASQNNHNIQINPNGNGQIIGGGTYFSRASVAAGVVGIVAQNQSNTAGAQALVATLVGGTSANDAYFQASNGTTTYSWGLDNSTGNYVLAASGTLGTSNIMTITDAGITNLFNNLSVTEAATNATAITIQNTNNASATADAHLRCIVGGASAGDPHVLWTVSGTQSWAAGIDNSDSDALVFSASTQPGTTNALRLGTDLSATFYGTMTVPGIVSFNTNADPGGIRIQGNIIQANGPGNFVIGSDAGFGTIILNDSVGITISVSDDIASGDINLSAAADGSININSTVISHYLPVVTAPVTIDLTSGAAQLVYTVPAGETFQLTRLLVRGATAITGSPQMACGSIGPGYADQVNAFAIPGGLNSGAAMAPVAPNPTIPTIAAAGTIYCIPTVTAAAGTITVQLEGILF